MSVNFPTDRPGAGLGSGPLQQGDVWKYNSITYTWVETPSGTGMWSSKGINFNPNLFIEKADSFEDNGGVISGSYSGTNFAVSYSATAGNATTADSATTADTATRATSAASADSATTAASATTATTANFATTAGSATTADSATTASSATTAGSATTASEADKVAHKLTLTFQPAVGPATTIDYDGSSAKSLTFTDTDIATDVINISGGKGIDVTGDEISVTNTVARGYGGYVTNHDYPDGGKPSTYLKVKQADNADRLGNLLAASYALKTEIPTIVPGITYQNGTGINIDGQNKINVTNSIARAGDGNYVINGSGTNLKTAQADRTTGVLRIYQDGVFKGSFNGVSKDIYLSAGGSTQNLNSVLGQGRFSGGKDLIVSDGANSIVKDGISLFPSGSMQLQRYIDGNGPFIDFTRGIGSAAQRDYECRITQIGKDLILETRADGQVLVSDGTTVFPIEPVPTTDPDGNTGIPEAPSNNKTYGRRNEGWTEIQEPGDIDVENFGADTHWDDLTGANDDDRFGQFVSYVNNGTRKSLFVPGGKTITLTSTHTFVNKVGFVGPPAALGKNLPGISFTHNSSVGLNCTAGIRARNFKFDGTGKDSGSESTQPTTLIRVGTFNGSNNEDDIDSSFRFCEFGKKHDGNVLQFNGRNVNVGNCAFSDCKGGATLLKLQWDNIQEDPSNDGDAFYTTSWRKNRIYNNQFHVHDSCTAIDVDGKHPIGGLAVTDNISDTGCSLLLIRGAGTNGCTVSGNVWYGRNLNQAGVIRIGEGTIHGMCITGNTFSGFHTNVSNGTGDVTDRPENFIKVTSPVTVLGLAITGNTFSYCTGRAIDIADDEDKAKTSVTGNVFTGTAIPPYPTNAVVHVGNVY